MRELVCGSSSFSVLSKFIFAYLSAPQLLNSGIVFPVKCKDLLPLHHVVINSVAVRGALGPLTVWVSNVEENNNNSNGRNNNNNNNSISGNYLNKKRVRMSPQYWTKIYEKTHAPSTHCFVKLDLSDNPILLKPGQIRVVYIHSTLPGDEAIVYDNRRQARSYDDALVSILTGRAHVSAEPFGRTPIWGWGNPWRDNREFVGRVEFGAVYKLWNPSTKDNFGGKFQAVVRTLFLCQRRWESPMSLLPDDCIFYILNMCRWDWVGDGSIDMKEMRSKRRQRFEKQRQEEEEEEEESNNAMVQSPPAAACAAATEHTAESYAEEMGANNQSSCCHRRRGATEEQAATTEVAEDDDDDDDGDYVEETEEDEDDDDAHANNSEISVASDGASDGWLDDEDEDIDEHDDDDDEDDYVDVFRYRDDESDDEEQEHVYGEDRRSWLRRQFASIHVLRALTNLDNHGVIEMNF